MSPTTSRKRIVITNIVTLNPGDAAILWGTFELLKKAYGSDVEIIVFDKFADAAAKHYPWANFRQSFFGSGRASKFDQALVRYGYGHWGNRLRFLRYSLAIKMMQKPISLLSLLITTRAERKDLECYLNADLILSTGGTYLIENYNLSSSIYDFRLCQKSGRPYGLFTQTLGPFKKKENQLAFKDIFSNARLIFLRDQQSKKHIQEIGVSNPNIHLAADAAFSMCRISANKEQSSPIRIAVSVRSLKFFSDELETEYFQSIASAIQDLVKNHQADITFLSTCQGIPEYWVDDSAVAVEICKLLPADIRQQVTVDSHFRQPEAIRDIYAGFDLVIATRMHAAILALCAGTPTLGIAYEFKTLELFNNLNMPENVISTQGITANQLIYKLSMMLDDLELQRKKVISTMPKMQTSAEHVIAPLNAL